MRLAAAALAASMILAGCGGGGGGGGSPTNTSQFTAPATTNPNAALAKFFATTATYKLAGTTSTGIDLTATVSVSPGAQATTAIGNFNTAIITLSVYQGANLYATNSQTVWLSLNGPSPAMYFNSSDGSCYSQASGFLPPTSAALETTGTVGTGLAFAGCRTNNLPMTYWVSSGDVTMLWEYRAMENGLPMVCLNTTKKDIFITTQEQDCIEVTDSSGNIGGRMRISITYTGSKAPNVTLRPV
jgi:hypothetical protein